MGKNPGKSANELKCSMCGDGIKMRNGLYKDPCRICREKKKKERTRRKKSLDFL